MNIGCQSCENLQTGKAAGFFATTFDFSLADNRYEPWLLSIRFYMVILQLARSTKGYPVRNHFPSP